MWLKSHKLYHKPFMTSEAQIQTRSWGAGKESACCVKNEDSGSLPSTSWRAGCGGTNDRTAEEAETDGTLLLIGRPA